MVGTYYFTEILVIEPRQRQRKLNALSMSNSTPHPEQMLAVSVDPFAAYDPAIKSVRAINVNFGEAIVTEEKADEENGL